MKTYKKTAISKLVACFEEELKNQLLADLKTYRSKHPFTRSNNQEQAQTRLSA